MQESYILNEGYNTQNLISHSSGAYIFIGKKKYLDLSNCAGSQMLGHNNQIIKNCLHELSKKKISNYANPNIHANEFGKTLKKINHNFSKFIFCNSGSESIMKALRICRAITKKEIIINASGSWHGSLNETLYNADKNLKNLSLSDGLPKDTKNKIKFIPYGNIQKSKKILDKFKSKACCILLEPIQGSLPNISNLKYIKFLQNYAKKNNLIFFLDEIITGLRDGGKSFQSNNKIKSDITVFGKAFGGGFPLGIIAISSKIHLKLKKKKLKIFFGGTFSGNSINMYVANKVTSYLTKNKSIYSSLSKKTAIFSDAINKFSEKKNLDIKVYSYCSMARIVFSNKTINNRSQRDFFEKKNNSKIQNFQNFIKQNKIFYPKNGIIFFSYAFTNKDLSFLIKVFKQGLTKYF